MIEKNYYSDPRDDEGFFPYRPLLKSKIHSGYNGEVVEKSYYIFYKYLALYMNEHRLFKNNLLDINIKWVNAFYNSFFYEDENEPITFILDDLEIEKMMNYILFHNLLNPNTGKEFIYKPVVQDEGYPYYYFEDIPFERQEDVVGMYYEFDDYGTYPKKYVKITQYGTDKIKDNDIIQNMDTNIKSISDEWKKQLRYLIEGLNHYNNCLCNRRCIYCGQILYKRKNANILTDFCDDCYPRKEDLKSNIKTNFIKRGYKICSNGRVDKNLTTPKVYARYNGICCCCKKKTDFNLKKYDDLYPNKDHIIPIAEGGENIITNTQLLCKKCNSEKGTKISSEVKEEYLRDKKIYEENFSKSKSTNIITSIRCYNCNKYNCKGFILQDNINFYCNDCSTISNENNLAEENYINKKANEIKFEDFKNLVFRDKKIKIQAIVFKLSNNEGAKEYYSNYNYLLEEVTYILDEITPEIIDYISKKGFYIGIINSDKSIDVLNLDMKGICMKSDEYYYNYQFDTQES